MRSVFSRRRLASSEAVMLAGLPLLHFVAMIARSRRPFSARPRSVSLSPYDSAVSKKLTPASSAACTTFAVAPSSRKCVKIVQPKLLQPTPTTETSSDPILRVRMVRILPVRRRIPPCDVHVCGTLRDEAKVSGIDDQKTDREMESKSKRGRQLSAWLGGRDSNPDTVVQSHVSYRWTTSQCQSRRDCAARTSDYSRRVQHWANG